MLKAMVEAETTYMPLSKKKEKIKSTESTGKAHKYNVYLNTKYVKF